MFYLRMLGLLVRGLTFSRPDLVARLIASGHALENIRQVII
jgi:hypothetical protein